MFDGRLPPSPTPARCASRAGSAPSPRIVGDARRSTRGALPVEEGLERIEPLYKPYHRALRRAAARARRALRHRRADRLPLHAVVDGRGATSGSAPDFVIGDRYGTSCARAARRAASRSLLRSSATRSAATSPMPAASSPSTTATRPRACTRSRSRSTARSTWTRLHWPRAPTSTRLPPTSANSSDGWGRPRCRTCRNIQPRGRIKKDRTVCGLEFGRKRPRGQAILSYRTAQYILHCTRNKASGAIIHAHGKYSP